MGLIALGANIPPLRQSANLADQLQLIKDLLSAPINTLVDDSSKIKEILEQIESQLPESLRVKLWPAGHLPFFRAEVKAAQQSHFDMIAYCLDCMLVAEAYCCARPASTIALARTLLPTPAHPAIQCNMAVVDAPR